MLSILILIISLLVGYGLYSGFVYLSLRKIGKVDLKLFSGPVSLMFVIQSILGWFLSLPIGLYIVHKKFKLSWGVSAKVIFASAIPSIVISILGVLIVHNFVFHAFHAVGASMSPNIKPADYLIISRSDYTKTLIEKIFNKDAKYIPDRGQVVVFRYPRDTSKIFIKRVVGLPGDHVVIKSGVVTIFNESVPAGFNPDSSYEKSGTMTLIDIDQTVANGSVFVIGDNRNPGASYDSREWGQLDTSYIIGNVAMRLLPIDNAKLF